MRDSKPKIVVFTPYFKARTEERQAELDECVRRNAACEEIDEVVLLIDDGHTPPVVSPKVKRVDIQTRPTYQDWLRLSYGRDEPIVTLLANTDIYFDDSATELRKFLVGPEKFLALTRFEKEGEEYFPHPNPHWSQDVWGFYTANAMHPALFKSLDIPLGVPRCDNKIAYLFALHGWEVFNPLGRVRTVHLHETQQRNYDKKADLTVMGGVAYVHVSDDEATPSLLEFDVWLKGASRVKKLALNKSLDKWSAEAGVAPKAPLNLADVPALPPAAPAPGASFGFVEPEQVRAALRQGKVLFDHRARFKVIDHEGAIVCVDALSPEQSCRLTPDAKEQLSKGLISPADIAASVFLQGAISTYPMQVAERPRNKDDVQFWQYPCATELQALNNVRREMHPVVRQLSSFGATAKVYVGLPWATYIDKKYTPTELRRYIAPRIAGLKQLAQDLGLALEVHTVCQQIHWARFSGEFADLGITDLHLSHAMSDQLEAIPGVRIHSWPLIAVNIEVPGRQAGLQFGKNPAEKKYLATFIGAHMKHYRSDIRVQLFEEAKRAGIDRVVVDLGGEWHFNKIVYQEQVAGKAIAAADKCKEEDATKRYNEVISESVFSLCPEGAGPNTLRLWESMAVGAIPVIFAEGWLPPEVSNPRGLAFSDAAILVNERDLDGIFLKLKNISESELIARSESAIYLYGMYKKMIPQ